MEEYVKLNIEKGIGIIEFFHPQSNSLPGNILSELANTITKDDTDLGIHTVCIIATNDFLKFSKQVGNEFV